LFARTEPALGNFFAVTEGASETEVLNNMRSIIADYLQHEGKTDVFWNGFTAVETIHFELQYDLQVFFELFKVLKITEIAQLAQLSASLVRQYAAGNKFPSAKQVKKIEAAVHELGQRLLNVKF
jgi:hypothetical protein